MNDFAFVAIILVSFALLTLFVKACDRIIGPDEEALPGESASGSGGDSDREAMAA